MHDHSAPKDILKHAVNYLNLRSAAANEKRCVKGSDKRETDETHGHRIGASIDQHHRIRRALASTTFEDCSAGLMRADSNVACRTVESNGDRIVGAFRRARVIITGSKHNLAGGACRELGYAVDICCAGDVWRIRRRRWGGRQGW